MEPSSNEVPVSSGHFRSRVSTTVSHRRMNASISQFNAGVEEDTRVWPSDTGPRASSTAANLNITHTRTGSIRQRLIISFLMLVCTVKFTFDVVLRAISYDIATVSPLDDLPQSFRLSRIANIYDPTELNPYSITPQRLDSSLLNVTACFWMTPEQLPSALQELSKWPGYASIALIHPEDLSGSAKRSLRNDLKTISRQVAIQSKLYLHIHSYPRRVPPPYSALINLARFYARTQSVMLVPSLAILGVLNEQTSLWEDILSSKGTVSTIITEAATDLETSIEKGELSSASAVFLDRDQGPWCPERFISSADTQWIHCLWHIWLRTQGDARILPYPTSISQGIQKDPDAPKYDIDILEKVDAMNGPKFKEEACMHLSRNIHALGQKEDGSAVHLQWLRRVCAEAFDTWGEALF